MLLHKQTNQQIERFLASPSHAVALSGEVGAGKGQASEYIAANLLKTTIEKLKKFPQFRHFPSSDKAIGIDEVREMKQFLTLSVPGTAKIRRVLVIKRIDDMGHEAQNALLKTLEETPQNTVIIATYSRENRVPSTIHSRMQHIQILPVDLQSAHDHFKSSFSKSEIERAYYISNGSTGLLSSLLQENDQHNLVLAINEAKKLISLSRYARMTNVDSITKSKDVEIPTLLDGMYRVLKASYKQGLNDNDSRQSRLIITKLKLVEQAIQDIDNNLSQKLVLSRLFFSL